MKTIIIDKNKISYKDCYTLIYKEIGADKNEEYINYPNFHFSPDCMYEYLCYGDIDILNIVLKNFDLDKIKQEKTHEDYRWNIIIETLQDFIKKRPINKLEFVND